MKLKEHGANKKMVMNNLMNANDMRLTVPTKDYRIFLYGF